MRNKDLVWILIPILVIFNTWLWRLSSFSYEGIGTGTTTDSFHYIKMAKNLPYIKESLFPILYPLFIKITNYFINDYYVSTKVIAIIVIIFCYTFTYYKNFFWKEFWTLLSLPTLLGLYFFSMSEIILLPLLLLLTYINYNYFNNKISDKVYTYGNMAILTLMCMTKYSALFILLGSFVFSCYLFFYRKEKFKPYFLSVLVAGIIIGGYLMMNHFYTGTFTGYRFPPIKEKMNITYSFFNIIYILNPIIIARVFLGYTINYIILACIDLIVLFLYVWIVSKNLFNKTSLKLDVAFCVINSLVFLAFTIATYFNTHINNLNARLLFPYFFLFLTAVIFSLRTHKKIYNLLFLIAIFSLIASISNGIYEYLQIV
ncbi:hypothetical protein [Chryseobacterium potabilaquae]|uniref:Glycosyltransferase RgtA/B/C/D-like domain-containing protein n=1 Tax=Chryseobacterium potabilaquae TaxID=2675057 RepID=A0A6N4X8N7_9FLAO|nr:hypothetical protein [Chryseobacterium potabilaquae]CAA7197142.1 hypothetical protein CHRY9293_03197 [Chryseobacterium potabilaquae]